MAKVTSKLQLTIPKAVAARYGIEPGDELDWQPAGDVIRVIPPGKETEKGEGRGVQDRLNIFDRATERQRRREAALQKRQKGSKEPSSRGWKREQLYARARPH